MCTCRSAAAGLERPLTGLQCYMRINKSENNTSKRKEKIYLLPVYTCGCVSVAYVCMSSYGLIRPNSLSFMFVDFLYQNPTVDPLKDEVSRK